MHELHFMIKEKGDCSIRVRSGDQVRITHAGFHERNGQPTKFDGNIEGEPLKVTVGKRKVIAGMDQVCELPRTLTQATPGAYSCETVKTLSDLEKAKVPLGRS